MNYTITIIDFKKGDSYLAKVTRNKSNRKNYKLFVTDNYELAQKFETDLGASIMMSLLEKRFNVEVEINNY